MAIVEINDELRIIVCEWLLANLKGNQLLRDFVKQSIKDSSDEESYLNLKKVTKDPMGLECLFALANKFSRPIWVYQSSGEILKNFEKFSGEPIRVDYDGSVYRISDI